jgi:hypothetical protein
MRLPRISAKHFGAFSVVGINRRPRPAPMMIARMKPRFRIMTLGTATAIFSQSDWKINPPRRPRALFLTAVAHFGQHRPQS